MNCGSAIHTSTPRIHRAKALHGDRTGSENRKKVARRNRSGIGQRKWVPKLAFGSALVACACFMAAQLTHDWVGVDFLPSQVVQAIGQSLGLTSLVWFFLKHLDPSQIFTFGAVLQTGRLFGAELGSAFVQTFTRVREQVYSNLVGLHVMTGAPDTSRRLQEYAQGLAGRSVGLPQADARATALLAHSVQIQASVLAYIDAFMVIGFGVIAVLLIMLLLRTPPSDRGVVMAAVAPPTA